MRSFGSRSARSTTYSSPTTSGSVLPRILSPELDDQPPVVDRQAHDLGEDPHRDLGGDDVDEVELVLLERALEDPARKPADPLLVRVDDPRREPLVDDRAHPRVRRRVGVEHRLPRLELLGRQVLERRAAELVGERLPVLRDRDDVVVARERPEAAALLLGLPEHRRIAAEEREPVVGHAALPDVEVGEVDVVEREPVERRAGDGRRLATPRRRRGRRARAPPRRRPAAARAGRAALRPPRAPRRSAAGRAPAASARRPCARRTRSRGTGRRRPARRARPRRASTPRACTCRRTRSTRPPSRPTHTARPPASTLRSVPSGGSSAGPTSCQSPSPSLRGWTVVERLVERRHAVVLGRVRGGVVDACRVAIDEQDREPDERDDDQRRASSRSPPSCSSSGRAGRG